MKKAIRHIFLLLLLATLGTAPIACNTTSKCPANNAGYMDSKKFVKKKNSGKPKSGLYPKKMKRR